MKDNFEEMEISDLALASALQCLGFSIISFNRDLKDFPKVGMVFEKTKKLEQTIQDYWNGSLLVEPKSYWSATREIKGRIRSQQ